MAIHEECGVFGVMSTQKENVAGITYYGLYALQHRGQESCGIVVNDDGVFSSYKDLGLVSEVFSKDTLYHLPEGTMSVGHDMEQPAGQHEITASPLKSTTRKERWHWHITEI